MMACMATVGVRAQGGTRKWEAWITFGFDT